MIDQQLIARKISLISQDLKNIQEIADESVEEFLGERIKRLAAERLLERVIGRMIDINFHIITEMGEAPPPDYFQSFTRLGGLKVLPVGFAQEVAGCAGLRNRLVHEYDEIDPKKLFAGLRSAAVDIPKYLEEIAGLIS